jgi:hypothetical protein
VVSDLIAVLAFCEATVQIIEIEGDWALLPVCPSYRLLNGNSLKCVVVDRQ